MTSTEGGMAQPQGNSFWVDLLGTEVRYRQASSYRTRSIEAGAGEPVVLLHGVSGHAETWVRNSAACTNSSLSAWAIMRASSPFITCCASPRRNFSALSRSCE